MELDSDGLEETWNQTMYDDYQGQPSRPFHNAKGGGQVNRAQLEFNYSIAKTVTHLCRSMHQVKGINLGL